MPDTLRNDLRRAVRERHAARLGLDAHGADEALDVDAMVGPEAAIVVCVVGTARRAHELYVFTRSRAGGGLDGALGIAIDYIDGVLEEAIGSEDAFLPLDWEGRPFDVDGESCVVFVRGEVRDYVAEEAAAVLLGEEQAPRAIPGFPPQ